MAKYYTAESENGDIVHDPSEDALYMRASDLHIPENSFLTVEPSEPSASWYVVIALQEDGSYEVEYSDPRRNEHELEKSRELSRICRDVTIWLRRALRYSE